MTALVYIMFILLIVASLAMIAIVLMQDAKSSGMGSAFGGGNTDNFFGRNRNKTREGRLQLYTKIIAGVIAVIAVALVIMTKLKIG